MKAQARSALSYLDVGTCSLEILDVRSPIPLLFLEYMRNRQLLDSKILSSRHAQTNSTPAAPANAPATPIIFVCPLTPIGAAAALLCVAAALPLALAEVLLDADSLLAEALAALPGGVTVTTLVAWLVAVLNSVGIVVLN